MADILEIKRLLASSAQSVAEMLLPGGRKNGPEWECGSIRGEKGESLKVHLAGPKAGIWQDFANPDDTGDLLDLWCAVRGVGIADAINQARSWLGISTPERFTVSDRPAYTRPPKPNVTKPKGKVFDYLTEMRNIPQAILDTYKIGAFGDEIIFPFLLPNGELALAKARKAEDGAAPKPTAANCEPVLFGWQAVPADAREIIITEGEIDAMSWAAYGFIAMSVPFGGGKGAKQKWIESEYDRLARFERIYLSTDMDKVGDEAAEEIASRLGRHRCVRVTLPRKDANECLVDGVTQQDMAKALMEAANLDPEGLHSPSVYGQRVANLFWPEAGEKSGYTTPYGKLDGKLTFRPGDLTLWTGASGSGKSQLLSDCIPHWILEGSRVCLASFEMPPAQTLRRMVKQAGNVDRPTRQYLDGILDYLDNGLLLYEKVGKSGVGPLLEIFDYARAKYGCDMFIIDSLMRLGIASDDYAGQERAVFQMVDWTLQHNVHTHLVAHARKGEKGAGAPELEDVKGASEIASNAANILSVWRNRRHEEELATADNEALKRQLSEKPGVILNVAKQRHGDFEGKIGLWFDQPTYRYQSSFDRSLWNNRTYPIERQYEDAA
jgi:twinkle protein